MYKVIYLCLPGQEDALKEHNFGIFDPIFKTKQGARDWIVGENGPIHQDIVDFIDGDPDIEAMTDFNREESEIDGIIEISHEVSQAGMLIYRMEYKVVVC